MCPEAAQHFDCLSSERTGAKGELHSSHANPRQEFCDKSLEEIRLYLRNMTLMIHMYICGGCQIFRTYSSERVKQGSRRHFVPRLYESRSEVMRARVFRGRALTQSPLQKASPPF